MCTQTTQTASAFPNKFNGRRTQKKGREKLSSKQQEAAASHESITGGTTEPKSNGEKDRHGQGSHSIDSNMVSAKKLIEEGTMKSKRVSESTSSVTCCSRRIESIGKKRKSSRGGMFRVRGSFLLLALVQLVSVVDGGSITTEQSSIRHSRYDVVQDNVKPRIDLHVLGEVSGNNNQNNLRGTDSGGDVIRKSTLTPAPVTRGITSTTAATSRSLKRGGGGGGLDIIPVWAYAVIGGVVLVVILAVVFCYNREKQTEKIQAKHKKAQKFGFDQMIKTIKREVREKAKKKTSIAMKNGSSKDKDTKKSKKSKKESKANDQFPQPKSGSYTTMYKEDRDREELSEILEFKFKKDSDSDSSVNGYVVTVDRPRFKFKEGYMTTYDGTMWWREIHEEEKAVEVLNICQYDFETKTLERGEWFSRTGLRGTLTGKMMAKRSNSYVSHFSTTSNKSGSGHGRPESPRKARRTTTNR